MSIETGLPRSQITSSPTLVVGGIASIFPGVVESPCIGDCHSRRVTMMMISAGGSLRFRRTPSVALTVHYVVVVAV
jgi:hypothetical protein